MLFEKIGAAFIVVSLFLMGFGIQGGPSLFLVSSTMMSIFYMFFGVPAFLNLYGKNIWEGNSYKVGLGVVLILIVAGIGLSTILMSCIFLILGYDGGPTLLYSGLIVEVPVIVLLILLRLIKKIDKDHYRAFFLRGFVVSLFGVTALVATDDTRDMVRGIRERELQHVDSVYHARLKQIDSLQSVNDSLMNVLESLDSACVSTKYSPYQTKRAELIQTVLNLPDVIRFSKLKLIRANHANIYVLVKRHEIKNSIPPIVQAGQLLRVVNSSDSLIVGDQPCYVFERFEIHGESAHVVMIFEITGATAFGDLHYENGRWVPDFGFWQGVR